MAVRESMFFFTGSEGKRLLGFLHLPELPLKSFAVLYCHPFAEERNLSHAIVVKAARAMAGAGIPVLRFDLSGCGDSEGELSDATWETWQEDMALAASHLKRETGVGRIGYWGLRTGATQALSAAAKAKDAAFLLLWHPVPDMKIFMTQFLRQHAASAIASTQPAADASVPGKSAATEIEAGETLEVLGYPISPGLFKSLNAVGSSPWKQSLPVPVAVFSIGTQTAAPTPIQKAASELSTQGGAVHLDHVQEPSFWDRFWCYDSRDLIGRSAVWAGNQA